MNDNISEDDKFLINGLKTSVVDKTVTLNFAYPKAVAQEMIKRKLNEVKQINDRKKKSQFDNFPHDALGLSRLGAGRRCDVAGFGAGGDDQKFQCPRRD